MDTTLPAADDTTIGDLLDDESDYWGSEWYPL